MHLNFDEMDVYWNTLSSSDVKFNLLLYAEFLANFLLYVPLHMVYFSPNGEIIWKILFFPEEVPIPKSVLFPMQNIQNQTYKM